MKDTSDSIESNEDSNVLTRHCMIDRKHSKHLGKEREATGTTHMFTILIGARVWAVWAILSFAPSVRLDSRVARTSFKGP